MLERILSEDIERISEDKICKIVMLVAYHDIIGDIIDKGRDRQQLIDIIEDVHVINMLVLLAKADVASLIPTSKFGKLLSDANRWLEKINSGAPDLKEWVLGEIEC